MGVLGGFLRVWVSPGGFLVGFRGAVRVLGVSEGGS